MRTIKFRGKDNHNTWRYGNLVYGEQIQPAIYLKYAMVYALTGYMLMRKR